MQEKLFGMCSVIFISESKFTFYELRRLRYEHMSNVFTVSAVVCPEAICIDLAISGTTSSSKLPRNIRRTARMVLSTEV